VVKNRGVDGRRDLFEAAVKQLVTFDAEIIVCEPANLEASSFGTAK